MIKYIIYTILFTLIISPLVAQDIGADQTIPMDPDIRIGKLDNGLTYYKAFPEENHVGIPCQHRCTIRHQRERFHVQKRDGIQYLRSSLNSGNDHRYRVVDASRLVQLHHL